MKSKVKRAICTGAAAGLSAVLLSLLPWLLEVEESVGLQALFRLRGPLPAPEDVAIVAIAGESADFYGLSSSDPDEWPRALHGELIDRLDEAGVSAIVMDIIFENPGDDAQDAKLAEAIARSGKVILLERVRSEPIEGTPVVAAIRDFRSQPIERFKTGAWATAPFVLPTVPLRVGQFWTFGRSSPDLANLPVVALQAHVLPVYETFIALLAAEAGVDVSMLPRSRDEAERLRGLDRVVRDIRRVFLADPALGSRMLAALADVSVSAPARASLRALIETYAGGDSRYLNYYGPTGTVRTIPYHVIEQGDRGTLENLALAGRVAFVGFSERRQAEQLDEFPSVYSERSGLNLSGVEIGATAFANLSSSSSVVPLSIPASLALAFGWGFVVAGAMTVLKARQAAVFALAIGVAYFALARYAFEAASLWLPLVAPLGVVLPAVLLGALLFKYREVSLQRQRIYAALGHYVPADVANHLAHDSFDTGASRELVHGTCLVSDAEQFTKLAESLDPESLHTLIQQYFEVLGACVERHGGFVADVSGDSMVAIWAAARPDAELRRSACRATLEALRAIEAFNVPRGRQGLPTGIGLDSGQLLLGSINVAQRYQYRAVGDIVNTASRIQGLNRQLGTRALVSAAAVDGLADLRTRAVGEFLLYGKTQPVVVHELLPPESERGAEELCAWFADALRFFRQRDWQEARRFLLRILERNPADGPSKFYVAQCDLAENTALPADWAGTIRMAVK
jgi:adenylate cyclase